MTVPATVSKVLLIDTKRLSFSFDFRRDERAIRTMMNRILRVLAAAAFSKMFSDDTFVMMTSAHGPPSVWEVKFYYSRNGRPASFSPTKVLWYDRLRRVHDVLRGIPYALRDIDYPFSDKLDNEELSRCALQVINHISDHVSEDTLREVVKMMRVRERIQLLKNSGQHREGSGCIITLLTDAMYFM